MRVKSRRVVFIIIWSFGFKVKSYCMVESSDAGEVKGRFFMIIWSFASQVKSYLHA